MPHYSGARTNTKDTTMSTYTYGENHTTQTLKAVKNLGAGIDAQLRRLHDIDVQIRAQTAAKLAELERIQAARHRLQTKATYKPAPGLAAAVAALNIPTDPDWATHRRQLNEDLDRYETRGKYARTEQHQKSAA